MNARVKKGDCVDIGIRYNGMIHWLYVRTVHKDKTVTLENIRGLFYDRISIKEIKQIAEEYIYSTEEEYEL